MTDAILKALRTVKDPEIPVNIYDLGLIYDVKVDGGHVHVTMTLTSPNCPVAEQLPQAVQRAIGALEGVDRVSIDLTFDPPWTRDRMSEAARLELGFMFDDGPQHHHGLRSTSLTVNRRRVR